MTLKAIFPTKLHEDTAGLVADYFRVIPEVDTVLVVNSCARGTAVADSDLDFAILVQSATTESTIKNIESSWQTYFNTQAAFLKYTSSGKFAHLHLDIITGLYAPPLAETGVGPDNFEIEIGNQICYSVPMYEAGLYFKELQNRWLPYYDEALRLERLRLAVSSCSYDLEHIPIYLNRGLYFHAFDTLYKAFREYLQALFIANKTYPVAYNKWIKEQVVNWLNKPALYKKLSPILSISDIESDEINEKARMLMELLNDVGMSSNPPV